MGADADLRGPIQEGELVAALRKALGPQRKVEQGIPHLRFTFAQPDEEAVLRRIMLASSLPTGRPLKGKMSIQAGVMGEGIAYVQFVLDGVVVKTTNLPPFDWEWDTATAANGGSRDRTTRSSQKHGPLSRKYGQNSGQARGWRRPSGRFSSTRGPPPR